VTYYVLDQDVKPSLLTRWLTFCQQKLVSANYYHWGHDLKGQIIAEKIHRYCCNGIV